MSPHASAINPPHLASAEADDTQADVIILHGRELKITVAYVDQMSLRFYAENPRIYSSLWRDDRLEPTQQEIFDVLSKRENVREVLLPSIRENGGLIEPLLVRGNVVLEGNSRLAAYRLLSQTDTAKWQKVRVRKLPETISDAEVFSLLGEYHIVGRTDWAPFEQAGYLYRRHKQFGVTVDTLHKEISIPASRIKHVITVYQYMIDVGDRQPNRWSYYDELLKGRRFAKVTEQYPDFNQVIVEKIQSGEIERAVDIRDRLPLIVAVGGNTLKRFIQGKTSFEHAVADARDRGAGDYTGRKLREFRNWLAEEQLVRELEKTGDSEKKSLRYELSQIERRVRKLLSVLGQ
jgi:hypothetical protein